MSEPIPTCIAIGGRLPRKLVPRLCEAIRADGLSLEWGDAPFRPQSAEELLEACRQEQGVRVLWLCDDGAHGGRLPRLEEFLTSKAKLPFDLRSDGKAEWDPELVVFRPGRKPVRLTTAANGEPVVIAKRLLPIAKILAQSAAAQRKADCQAGVRQAWQRLQAILPPVLPPLTPFAID